MNTRETDTVRIIHPDMIDYYNEEEQIKPDSCEDRSIEHNPDETEEALSDQNRKSLYDNHVYGDPGEDLIYSNDVINNENHSGTQYQETPEEDNYQEMYENYMNQNTEDEDIEDEDQEEINNHDDDNNSVIDLNDEKRIGINSISGNRQHMPIGSNYSNEEQQINDMNQFSQQNNRHNQRVISFAKNDPSNQLMLENDNNDNEHDQWEEKDWEIYQLYTNKIEQLEAEIENERKFSENQRVDIQNEIIKVNADKILLEQQLSKVLNENEMLRTEKCVQEKSRTSVYQDESVTHKDAGSQDVSKRNSIQNFNTLVYDEDLLVQIEDKIRSEVEKIYEDRLEEQLIIMKEKTAQEINDFHEKAQTEYEDLL